MADQAVHGPGNTRRDFLELVTWSTLAVGAASLVWPLINQMNPSADVLALSSTEVDISLVPEGSAITVKWRGKPVFVRNRTSTEVEEAVSVDIATLRDPQTDEARRQKAEWLIVVGVCTHLGCVPLGNKPTEPRGDYGGWFCPCHGSHYDTSGRIRRGPAPTNLTVPDYAYVSDTVVRIG
jgi:ubiquinol-cytochrome c reductase iron-sulfur subunit